MRRRPMTGSAAGGWGWRSSGERPARALRVA